MKIKRLHIGALVKQKVEEKGLNNAEFARHLGMHRQNVVKQVFEKESLDTNLLCLISEALDCNLFDYFKSSGNEDKQEVKATITIELGRERKDRTVRFIFGENDIKLQATEQND